MLAMIKGFKKLTAEEQNLAGGKGGMLARLYQMGYPVPEGFVIFPLAFQEEKLTAEAWKKIQAYLLSIRQNHKGAEFAVRSSALSEDSAQASFAGEFETVLNVKTDSDILGAIYEVYNSRHSERVKVYSTFQGFEGNHQIAVVVQLMVASELSGVLFTADPISGSFANMIGNYVHGLGEQLVSGEATGYDFKLIRPKGKYDGPAELKQYAKELFKYADKLEKDLGGPQDIEWAVAKGKLYLLQARPVTTVSAGNLETYEINESLAGDTLWVNTNVGEAIPDVVSPLTWSLVRALDIESSSIPGYYLWSGNICGRIYSNIGHRLSAVTALYGKSDFALKLLGEIFGQLPENLSVPTYPFTRLGLIKVLLPRVKHYAKNLIKATKKMPQHIAETPEWCRRTETKIKSAKTEEELLNLWKQELEPYNYKAWWGLLAGGTKAALALSLNKKLTEMVGTEDSNTLLSNLRGDSELESLGPVLGISKVIEGVISREEYLFQYGHRSAHEFELSIPDPSEDKNWLEKQIVEYKKSDINVDSLLKKQHNNYEDTLHRFKDKFPNKIKWLNKQIAKASEGARVREAARSEFVRVFRLNRNFALKVGEIKGIGEEVFYLYINELINLLSGDSYVLKYIPVRRANYQKYKELPAFPSVIRGRFNPYEWMKDENKRMDYYDSTMPVVVATDTETLKGFAGAAGRIEGIVRILLNPEEGDKLQPGEILVATTTNVGWTPLFPRAGAIITDVGAPLSHAAIVARELGIPAVVGCGNATIRLKTGDRVIVDGGQGIVHILD